MGLAGNSNSNSNSNRQILMCNYPHVGEPSETNAHLDKPLII